MPVGKAQKPAVGAKQIVDSRAAKEFSAASENLALLAVCRKKVMGNNVVGGNAELICNGTAQRKFGVSAYERLNFLLNFDF